MYDDYNKGVLPILLKTCGKVGKGYWMAMLIM